MLIQEVINQQWIPAVLDCHMLANGDLDVKTEAALAIWFTEREPRRRSAAWPFICSEFFATPRERERSMAFVAGLR